MTSVSKSIKLTYVLVAIALLSVGLHWNIWNADIAGIHAWRQTQTMSVVENFASEDMNILNPRINSRGNGDGIMRMEFPLLQWTFAWFYKWFGQNLIIARMLSFLIFLISLIGFYRLLKAWGKSDIIGATGTWCFAWSPLLFYYSVNPLPDNLALCFGIWSLVFLKRFQLNESNLSLVGFGVCLSLATAVKLPFILFGAGFIPIFLGRVQVSIKETAKSGLILMLLMAPAVTWYLWVIPQWGNAGIISGIAAGSGFEYASAMATLWGIFHSMLPELFINFGSVLFFLFGIYHFFSKADSINRYTSELFILVALFLFLIYEVNMIGLQHDYYLFPFLPLIFLVVAAGIEKILDSKQVALKYLGVIALVVLPATAYLRIQGRWSPTEKEIVLLENKDELRKLIPDNALVVVGNDPSGHIYLYHLGRKGWTFEQDWLVASDLNEFVNDGAQFIVTNTSLVEETETLNQFLGEPLFDKDGLRVYPLVHLTDS